LTFLVTMLVVCPADLSAQVYGLAFKSKSSLKENRTRLDLNPEKYFVFESDFRITFKFRLQPGNIMYFGYIARIIDGVDNNVDLIYNHQSSSLNSFDIICGDKIEDHSVRTNFRKLCQEWTDLSLEYDFNTRELNFITPDTTLIIKDVILDNRIKIIFGASNINRFKTTDVPPMIIRDIRISQKSKKLHEWLLDESAGNIAFDKTGKIKAIVENPDWLNPKHVNWIKIFGGKTAGIAEVAFNPVSGLVYIVGNEYLLTVSVPDNIVDTVRYSNNPLILKAGCQAFYDPDKDVIISYNVDVRTVATLNIGTGYWTQTVLPSYPLTVYWQHNKLYLGEDSMLLVFGGYGQHEYKNCINRFSFSSNRWDTVFPIGESYPPRYLSALGSLMDTAYILGGYGSLSGKQIMNPQNFYDLWGYSLKENMFFKKYEFKTPIEDIAFSNSLVIDQDTRNFYALACPILKYDTYLQLVKGSLSHPDIIPVGREIPYHFHDIISFSDLFLCNSSQKLVCATLLADNENNTEVNIFTIGFPPNQVVESTGITETRNKNILFLIPVIMLMAFIPLYLFYRKRQRKKQVEQIDIAAGKSKSSMTWSEIINETENRKDINSIIFFGDFQIFNNKGEDITHRFSPLLKELFLLIWFYSLKDKGISSEKIKEILWFDKDDKSAKNNLAVNLTKLKHILSGLDTMKLSHQTGYWKFTYNDKVVYNDYVQCFKIVSTPKPLSKDMVGQLIGITQKGNFLASSPLEWLDVFKADISNAIIDALIGFSTNINMETDSDLAVHLAETIMNADILNEEALKLKCKALMAQGKHALSKEAYAKFVREYKTLINVPYSVPFIEIIR
jgi:DNA-binding SARP family transcriptional activator